MSTVSSAIHFLDSHPNKITSMKGRELLKQLGQNHDHLSNDRAYLRDQLTTGEELLLAELETNDL